MIEKRRYEWKEKEGVEELKRNEMRKGEKKWALHIFNHRSDTGYNSYATDCYQGDIGIEDKTSGTQWRTALNLLATRVSLKIYLFHSYREPA